MNKTAIKNFAIWARNKLIADISYRAGLMGITEKGIADPLPQSTSDTQFYDIGTAQPYAIHGDEIRQRRKLVEVIRQKEADSNYKTAYQYIIEEVAYTWFNRLIAVRFMEVNDYLPSHIRVLSSESGKLEPDLVTNPFDAEIEFKKAEESALMEYRQNNQIDEAFRLLFRLQCNALHEFLPGLFETTADYTELLLNLSIIDQEGVVYHLVHDIPEDDFNVENGGQVAIIGWLYQYYNTEPKDAAFKKDDKISKEEIPAVTQLFTPDWIVHYMVENSLGRLWVDGHLDNSTELKKNWKYYLEETEQGPEVRIKLAELQKEYAQLSPASLTFIDPCMGSGHILVYAFDVLMQIYENVGYSQRDAAQNILKYNLYGLDIDDRAAQLAYFAVMMKARQYDGRIFKRGIQPHVFAIQESNTVNRNHLKYLGAGLSELERNAAKVQLEGLLGGLEDAKEYGSILNVDNCNWTLLRRYVSGIEMPDQFTLDSYGVEETTEQLNNLIDIGEAMARKYWITCTNPPYMGGRNMNERLLEKIVAEYPEGKADIYAAFILRTNEMTAEHGYTSLITQHSWMFLSSFESLRARFVKDNLVNMCHLGPHAFEDISGEVVQTTSWVTRKIYLPRYKGTYIRLVKYDTQLNKEMAYLGGEAPRYDVVQTQFDSIPGHAFAYWLGNLDVFVQGEALEAIANPRQGMKTLNNDYYIRFWHEISRTNIYLSAKSADEAIQSKCKWFPINHGGEYRKYYGNNYTVVNWYNDGEEMKANAIRKYKSITRTITNIGYYFKPGITWSVICSYPSFRWYGNGFLFSNGGQCVVPDNYEKLVYIMGILNSKVTEYLLNILSPTLGFESGYLKKIPIIINEQYLGAVEKLTEANVDLCKRDWDSFEISWDFNRHPLVQNCCTIAEAYDHWSRECSDRYEQLKCNEEELNRIFINIYGLQNELTPCVDSKYITVRKDDLSRDIKGLISYAVGCMFGRYSLDENGLSYAGGEWNYSKYHTYLPDEDNCIPICDESYFEDDVVGRFVEFIKIVYGEKSLEINLDFIASALGNKGTTSREVIRNYFLNDFIRDHNKNYQKCPIYWLFDSGKHNGFKALIYLHRYTPNTIGDLRVDYLHRIQHIYESEIKRMQDMIMHSVSPLEVAASTKRKEKLQKQLKECRDYDEKIGHLALSRINLDLDDGVKVNYRKVQTAQDGKFYEVLADSKNIMAKDKLWNEYLTKWKH